MLEDGQMAQWIEYLVDNHYHLSSNPQLSCKSVRVQWRALVTLALGWWEGRQMYPWSSLVSHISQISKFLVQ